MRKVVISLLLTLLVSSIGLGFYMSSYRLEQAGVKVINANAAPGPSRSVISATNTYTIHLPLLSLNSPVQPTIFGIEVNGFSDPGVVQKAVAGGAYWARMTVIDWNKIEGGAINPMSQDWSSVPEQGLMNVTQNYMQAIAIVKNVPEWARSTQAVDGMDGAVCGPIAESKFADFASFMTKVVSKYSQPPYNVRYWEIGNEPDAPTTVNEPEIHGCWGNSNVPDGYGGGYYSKMLSVIYPAIKAADPKAQVLIGGLLLDCDPGDTNDCSGAKALPATFFEGILKDGQGNNFDIVSFHGYPQYNPTTQIINDVNFPTWDLRSGVVLGKIDFLKEKMAQYGVTKPIIHTEGSLICPACSTPLTQQEQDGLYDAQADYVVWLYVRNLSEGLMGTVWYQFGAGWRYGGLLGGDTLNPKPAYNAFVFITKYLKRANYLEPVTSYPDFVGYKFTDMGKEIWVLWAKDFTGHEITLPTNYTKVLDKYGTDITSTVVSGQKITVKNPVYVEVVP